MCLVSTYEQWDTEQPVQRSVSYGWLVETGITCSYCTVPNNARRKTEVGNETSNSKGRSMSRRRSTPHDDQAAVRLAATHG
jgi:hypothetical protein